MAVRKLNTFGARGTLKTASGDYLIYRLERLEKESVGRISSLPLSIRILLEAALRHEDGKLVTSGDVGNLAKYNPSPRPRPDTPFLPARVLLQDFTGVPSLVDMAAMRSATARLGGDPGTVNPKVRADLVIDHSIQVDHFASLDALALNTEIEFERNRERYEFLKWGRQAFEKLRVVPPASGIVHQVNLEHLAGVVLSEDEGGARTAYPDSLVGTDSHTTMINGLGVLGWGVGGIEAEAAMLGQPLYMLLPDVVGVHVDGRLPEGATATDLVLTVTRLLRETGVVGKFVEFCGPGVASLSLPDRATVANMSPEYGATMGFFPVDDETLRYLAGTGRPPEVVDLVERYTKEQGLFLESGAGIPEFSNLVHLDLGTISAGLAGPKRPQDRKDLGEMKQAWQVGLSAPLEEQGFALPADALPKQRQVTWEDGEQSRLGHGAVVIAAITSCTNTSNPSVMLAAGLLARNAVKRGLGVERYVKTSLAPGSLVVTEYLNNAGLTPYLDTLGFQTVGYGCTTCIGNSGPLPAPVAAAVEEGDLVVASVLSGNRNFEGRINPLTRANYLASPPLVVAYALAGTIDIDLTRDPLGTDAAGEPVFLKEIWPSGTEIAAAMANALNPEMFHRVYDGIDDSNEQWNQIPIAAEPLYQWNDDSDYIHEPPFLSEMGLEPPGAGPIVDARPLLWLGDSVTTDHISPAGAIAPESPAGLYLQSRGVLPRDFNSYGSRRGNDRVMTRGTFANIRLRNRLAPGTEGGFTTILPDGDVVPIFDAAEIYKERGIPTVVLAGRDYGMGSSRDWAAKGPLLLGVKAVFAVSFERIHRSNLVGMGILPLQFREGEDPGSLGLTGRETFTIPSGDHLRPGQELAVTVTDGDGEARSIHVLCRLDAPIDIDYYRHGGILQAVLRGMLAATD